MNRYTKLGFVVSLHLGVYAAAAGAADNAGASLAFGAASALVLGLSLFYEASV